MNTAYSNYLQRIEERYAQQLAALPDDDQLALQQLIEQTRDLPLAPSTKSTASAGGSAIAGDEDFGDALRRFKAVFAYRWSRARLGQSLPDELLGQLQTSFAEISIDKALAAAWSDPQFDKLVPPDKRNPDGSVPGLFILGLGKLGGFDLNFSSDIDLVAFYDPAILPVASMQGRTDVATRALKKMNQLLAKKVADEFVWRVDWRLRPNASAMALTMPISTAEDFYFFHSFPWHRLAMIKSRVVAGDINAGDRFLEDLEPYLWRQNLDYEMVDEVFRLKQKINLEHPQLKHARSSGALHDKDQGEGFNLKLGRGGIREIEFVVNAMQLLWGGKKPGLRTRRTLTTLQQLQQCGLLEAAQAGQLDAAYRFYRLLEDALQMLENSQTHQLPREPEQLQQLLGLLGEFEAESLWATLSDHREHVITIFDTLFDNRNAPAQRNSAAAADAESDASALARVEALPWIAALPPAEKSIFEGWHKGFALYGVSQAQALALQSLFVQLADLLDTTSIDRVNAIAHLHEFFKAIPKGGQYLRLLAQHPRLLRGLVRPLLYSPHMSQLLEQSPHIVDMLLEPAQPGIDETDFNSDFVLQTDNFETRLERLRRFVNEQLYIHCLQLFQGQATALALQQRLTALAEHTIALGLNITCQQLELPEAPIAVLGMGKLGMRAMAPISDLDLIFIARDEVAPEHANQFSNRFENLMELRTREGRAYEMDMRLRPSGRSGPATVSLRSFSNYQLGSAKTWEHIALTAGRPVAGPAELQHSVAAVRATVLAAPRDRAQFKLDAAKMLRRLQVQRIGKTGKAGKPGLDVKLRPGGLMELDYLSACACLLAEPGAELSAQPYDAMVRAVLAPGQPACELLSVRGKLATPDTLAETIAEATHFWRRMQIWSRIAGLDDIELAELEPGIAEHLLRDMQMESIAELEAKVVVTSGLVSGLIEVLQEDFEREAPENWESWQEAAVKWRE